MHCRLVATCGVRPPSVAGVPDGAAFSPGAPCLTVRTSVSETVSKVFQRHVSSARQLCEVVRVLAKCSSQLPKRGGGRWRSEGFSGVASLVSFANSTLPPPPNHAHHRVTSCRAASPIIRIDNVMRIRNIVLFFWTLGDVVSGAGARAGLPILGPPGGMETRRGSIPPPWRT